VRSAKGANLKDPQLYHGANPSDELAHLVEENLVSTLVVPVMYRGTPLD
jgi:hypothetical protein